MILICDLRLFLLFFEKISDHIRVVKLDFVEDHILIIAHIVFLRISYSEDISEIISHEIFNECSKFHLFISFRSICFFQKWKRFAFEHFQMRQFMSINWLFDQLFERYSWRISFLRLSRRSIHDIRDDKITFRVQILKQLCMLFYAFCFFDQPFIKTFRFFVLFWSILRRSILFDFLRAYSVFQFCVDEDFLTRANSSNYRVFFESHSITKINQIFEDWQ